jgi:hypothetical protein
VIAVTAAAAWLLAIAPAEAPTSRVVVRAEGCEGLVPDEVGRVLDLELSMVTTEIRSGPPLEVGLRCAGERLTITVLDPLTRKRLERDVPAPAPEPGRERVVALAVSQLFAASWLELLSTDPPPPPPPDDPAPPSEPTAIEAARRVAEATTETSTETEPPRRPALELLVGAGARGRALESDGRMAAARGELLLRAWLRPSVGLVALAGWDFGQSTRRLGQVRGHALTAGGGLAWSVRPGTVGLGGHVLVVAGWARVRGLPREPGVPSGANAGFTAEASAGLGPRVRYGRLRFDLDAELGTMLRSPTGLVADGPPMTMGGLWAGVVLRLGGALLPRGP